jgi:8-oxo-dGTP pyrophosphatase MutT (NUDIX family)
MDKKRRRNLSSTELEHKPLIKSVGALIHCQSTDRYLFVLRSGHSYSGTWGLPGGKVDPGETIDQALHREIHEELGGKILGAKLALIKTFVSCNKKFEYHTFLINVEEEFMPWLNNEHSGYAWCKIKEHPKPLHPGVWKTISFDEVLEKIQKEASSSE